MSFRRLITVGVLAASAGVIALPALPGQAAGGPNTGNCKPDYPPGPPQISMDLTSRKVTAGQSTTAFGELRQKQCPIRGAHVVIQRKRVVNGAATGGWLTVGSATTSKNGLYIVSTAPLHNELLRARFNAANGFSRATSLNVPVNVRTKITEAASKGSSCKITLTGATKPVKGNHTVTIQKRGPKGHFHGWTTFATGKTGKGGHYSITKTAKCGTTYNLSALIAKDATNLAGRSATIFGIKATH